MRPWFEASGSDRLDRSWISREVGVRGEQHDPFHQRCAISMRSNGSLCSGGRRSRATAWALVTGSSASPLSSRLPWAAPRIECCAETPASNPAPDQHDETWSRFQWQVGCENRHSASRLIGSRLGFRFQHEVPSLLPNAFDKQPIADHLAATSEDVPWDVVEFL